MLATFAASACSGENVDTPAKYFATRKVGESADFGVFKHGTDHVISVHGFLSDDLQVCVQIANMLNKEEPNAGYECKPLNH